MKILFVHLYFSVLEVSGKVGAGAIVGPNRYGFVVSSENDRGRPVVVNIGVMSIADPQQVGANCKGYPLTLVHEGDPFAGSDVNGTVDTVDNIERPHLGVDEYFGVLAANYPQIFVSDLLLDGNHIAKPLQADEFYLDVSVPCSLMMMRGTIWSLIVEAFSF